MAEIDHSIQGDESAEVEISEEFGAGFYFRFLGNGSAVRVYLEFEHMEALFNQLKEFGFGENHAA